MTKRRNLDADRQAIRDAQLSQRHALPILEPPVSANAEHCLVDAQRSAVVAGQAMRQALLAAGHLDSDGAADAAVALAAVLASAVSAAEYAASAMPPTAYPHDVQRACGNARMWAGWAAEDRYSLRIGGQGSAVITTLYLAGHAIGLASSETNRWMVSPRRDDGDYKTYTAVWHALLAAASAIEASQTLLRIQQIAANIRQVVAAEEKVQP